MEILYDGFIPKNREAKILFFFYKNIVKEIDDFKELCTDIAQKRDTLLSNVKNYVAKYPSTEDAPIEEFNAIKKQIAEQSIWINKVNHAYEIARNKIIDSIDNDIIKEYTKGLMDSLSTISRLAALEEGEKMLNNVKNYLK